MKRAKHALLLSVAGAGLLAVSAYAQQTAPPIQPAPPPQATSPAQTPSTTQGAPGAGAQTSPDAQRSQGQFSADDRAAFAEARLASIRAGLKLTPDQEKLWPPVESAVRDMVRQMSEMREQRRSQAAPSDPIDRMARMGEAATKRGAAMTRLAEAARPLYATLSDEQKRRLRVLIRSSWSEGHRGMMMDRDDRGYSGHHHRYRHHDGMWGRGDRESREYDREGRRGWRDRDDWRDSGDWRDSREGRDWRMDRGWRDERDWRGYDREGSRWNDWR